MPPNVLLVVFDTARADAFEPYGAGVGAGPAVAQLARRGSAFPVAYAPSNWTVPSHVSMFTGLTPRESGLAQVPEGKALYCRPYVEAVRDRSLPEVLRKAGYSTRGVSANGWISTDTGFATGFDAFHDVRSTRKESPSDVRVRGRIAWALECLRARADDGAAAAEEVIRAWMNEERTQPFFWFVNLVECHSPYLPPRPYSGMSWRARLRSADDVRDHQTLAAVWRACIVRDPIPADALARMRHLYGSAIRALDDWLGRILEEMDRRRLLDDTLVIVTSDHGENLGESNLIGHAFSLDERLIHIPLVVAGPAAFSSDKPMSLIDLPKLIAHALELPDHPWTDGAPANGVVVSQYDSMGTRDDPRVVRVTSEWGLDEEAITRLTCSGTSATDGTLKLVREDGIERLFDLRTDPLETKPLGAPSAAGGVVDVLRAAVTGAERELPLVKPETAPPDEESADLEERLKLLGYL